MFKHGGGDKKRSDQSRLDDRVKRISDAAAEKRAATLPAPPITERRAADVERRPSYVAGFLILDDGESFEVVISNISDEGAEVRSVRFFHHLKPRLLVAPSLNLNRRIRIVWRKANVFGVEFVD